MRKRTRIKLEGMEDTMLRLAQSGQSAIDVLEAAVHAGAALVVKIADANAPESGVVKKETNEQQKRRASRVVDIGVDKRKFWLQFFEKGAKEHEIEGEPLVFEGSDYDMNAGEENGNGLVVTWSVDHPGMVAEPFLRPALDGQKNNAVAAVGKVLKDAL